MAGAVGRTNAMVDGHLPVPREVGVELHRTAENPEAVTFGGGEHVMQLGSTSVLETEHRHMSDEVMVHEYGHILLNELILQNTSSEDEAARVFQTTWFNAFGELFGDALAVLESADPTAFSRFPVLDDTRGYRNFAEHHETDQMVQALGRTEASLPHLALAEVRSLVWDAYTYHAARDRDVRGQLVSDLGHAMLRLLLRQDTGGLSLEGINQALIAEFAGSSLVAEYLSRSE